eukprot:103769-Chlamydomonas_euryale.AAC.2
MHCCDNLANSAAVSSLGGGEPPSNGASAADDEGPAPVLVATPALVPALVSAANVTALADNRPTSGAAAWPEFPAPPPATVVLAASMAVVAAAAALGANDALDVVAIRPGASPISVSPTLSDAPASSATAGAAAAAPPSTSGILDAPTSPASVATFPAPASAASLTRAAFSASAALSASAAAAASAAVALSRSSSIWPDAARSTASASCSTSSRMPAERDTTGLFSVDNNTSSAAGGVAPSTSPEAPAAAPRCLAACLPEGALGPLGSSLGSAGARLFGGTCSMTSVRATPTEWRARYATISSTRRWCCGWSSAPGAPPPPPLPPPMSMGSACACTCCVCDAATVAIIMRSSVARVRVWSHRLSSTCWNADLAVLLADIACSVATSTDRSDTSSSGGLSRAAAA